MAGYIFNIGPSNNVNEIMKSGIYATFLKTLASIPFEGTFADYVTMSEGDNVYFFQKRKIYGIGKLKKVGLDCKYNNFIGATKPIKYNYELIKESLIVDFGLESHKYRWVCFFEGSPKMMKAGLDMDEVLEYKPDTFKSLRTMWKRSFIKIDDIENKSLKELFYIRSFNEKTNYEVVCNYSYYSDKITNQHLLNYKDLIEYTKNNEKLVHEMALEASTLAKIKLIDDNIFGKWDFVSHQVCASPFKPVDYMDKIDIFAYKYTEIDNEKVISKYMVVELKKDCANVNTMTQITNYVDWICNNYTYGDYSLIEAYILAADFDSNMYECEDLTKRTYNIGSHPIKVKKWDNLKFIKYKIINNDIEYFDVTNPI